MSRKLKVDFNELPVIKIRVIDKNDSDFTIKAKKKYPFVLKKSVKVYVSEEEKNLKFEFEIPKNYIWNGADIPKCLFFVGQSKDNNYLLASMVHDFMLEKREYLYNEVLKKSLTSKEYRKLTSLVFREILKDEKTNTIKANCMAFAVDTYQNFCQAKIWKALEVE